MDIHKRLKNASTNTNKAQRNYDLTKTIPQEDLNTLIHVAVNSPSKQNETHYSLHVYTAVSYTHLTLPTNREV